MKKIQGVVKDYAWGKPGPDSLVRLVGNLQNCPDVLSKDTCAEIWWGTHKDGTAKILGDNEDETKTLKDFYPEGDLSFLLKVSSFNPRFSLSIDVFHYKFILIEKMQKNFSKFLNCKTITNTLILMTNLKWSSH
jgi:mannose-6-phosphate isomerase class I